MIQSKEYIIHQIANDIKLISDKNILILNGAIYWSIRFNCFFVSLLSGEIITIM